MSEANPRISRRKGCRALKGRQTSAGGEPTRRRQSDDGHFASKERRPLIKPEWRPRLHAYLGGIARTLGAAPIEIGGVADHAHLFLGIRPAQKLADLVRTIKNESSAWVHQKLGEPFFGWQDGYAAFSVSPSQIDTLRRYIRNQAEHHRVRTFDEELRSLLAEHGITPWEGG